MKRIISLYTAVILSLCYGHSQSMKDMYIEDLTLELMTDGNLRVDIDLDLSNLEVKNTQVVTFTPSIVNGRDTLMLKSIGVYGRNRRIFYERNESEKPTGKNDINLSPSEARGLVTYSTTVRFMDWMDGCSLMLERTDFGCCGQSALVDRTELVERFPLERFYPELIYLRPESESVKVREINGSAYINFPVNVTTIDPLYRNNTMELAKITGTIDSVKLDDDITIKSIFIKGYASPESSYSKNALLAKGRTESLKDYVESLYHFGDDFIQTDFEPEDWAGFERFVSGSSLPNKDEILAAIHSDREPDERELYIKSRWKEDYKYILEHCYPSLRHSDYKIEYEIRSYSDPEEIEKILLTAPQNLSLEEFYILAQTYEPGSDEFDELFETAVRIYPDDPVANLNAANSAILRNDFKRATRYLERAGDRPEAFYTRGALEVFREDYQSARTYLEEALAGGIEQAEEALNEISKNRFIYKMHINN